MSQPSPACCNTHCDSALSTQLLQLAICRISILVYTIYLFYFYFFVATITEPGLPLPVATAMKLASALSAQLLQLAVCRLLVSIYTFYFLFLFYLLQQFVLSLPSLPVATVTKLFSTQLMQHAACRLYIYIYIYCCNNYCACLLLLQAARCNSHEACFSAQRSAVATWRMSFIFFISLQQLLNLP